MNDYDLLIRINPFFYGVGAGDEGRCLAWFYKEEGLVSQESGEELKVSKRLPRFELNFRIGRKEGPVRP